VSLYIAEKAKAPKKTLFNASSHFSPGQLRPRKDTSFSSVLKTLMQIKPKCTRELQNSMFEKRYLYAKIYQTPFSCHGR